MNALSARSTGIALLMAAALLVALFAWGAFPVGAQTTDPSVTVSPETVMPGEEVTVRGTDFTVGDTVDIVIRNRGTDQDDDENGASTPYNGGADVTVLSTGSFTVSFVLADTVAKGNKVLAIRASDAAAVDDDLATDNFTVEVDPTIRAFYSAAVDGTKVESVNNAIENMVFAEIHGFKVVEEAGDDVDFTIVDSEGETVEVGSHAGEVTLAAQRVELTIPADVPAGDLTITATQGTIEVMKDLMVVTPTIMLSPMLDDNSMEVEVTVTGSNFGAGTAALVFADLDIAVTAKDEDDDDVGVEDVMPAGDCLVGTPVGETCGFMADDTTGFTQKITLPVGTDPGDITIAIEGDPDGSSNAVLAAYADKATFMLKPAPPAMVEGVKVTPGEGSLAVTWDQVLAIEDDDEKRPAASGYKVEWKLVSAADWTEMAMVPGGSQVYHLIPGLTPGRPYMVRVSAMAEAEGVDDGMASAINADAVSVPLAVPAEATVPGLVQSLSVSAVSETQLSVSWNPPASDGGAAITGYSVGHRVFGTSDWTPVDRTGTDVGQSISGLTAGTPYEVRVAAMNSKGTGTYRQATESTMEVTDNTAPGPVQVLAVRALSNTELYVSWSAPTSDGGATITKYVIQYRPFGRGQWASKEAPGVATDITLNKLDANTEYQVRVSAVNDEGQGVAQEVQGTTNATPTTFPTGLTVKTDAVSSDVPGATVRVQVNAQLSTSQGASIPVKLDKFGLPDSIDESDVTIQTDNGVMYFRGNPRDVTSSGSTVTLWLGSLKGVNDATKTITSLNSARVTTIIIQQDAGITNPNKAGTYDIQINGQTQIFNQAIVNEKVSVKPTSGARGVEITVTGKGFGTGTASVFLGEDTLASNVAIVDGSFEATLAVGDEFDPGANVINAIDSEGNQADKGDTATFTLKPKVTASPTEAARDTEVTLKVSDWNPDLGNVDRILFGRMPADFTGDVSSGKGELKATVPSSAVIGVNKVSLQVITNGDNKTEASVNVTVKVLGLSVSPTTVVPGQQVTITGSGFHKSSDITSIDIGGKSVDIPRDATSTSTGRISVTVKVPLDVGTGDKDVEVTVTDDKDTTNTKDDVSRTGESEITVAKPSVTVSPDVSAPGTIVTVSGSGFASGERIEVLYEGEIEVVGKADSNGDFSLRLTVPSDAGIGVTNTVRVEVRKQDSIFAEAKHKTPGAMITLPTQAQSGSMITITGSNFAPFSVLSKVTIGTQNAMPSPAPETDKNGQFSFQARVPRLGVGSHTVTVEDSGTPKNTATETFTVSDTPIVSTPAEVFGSLGDKLLVVWRYDNATTSWASYDPNAPAELNDLTGVSRGDIVWVEVTENVMFQGGTLYAGWNLISLE